jgi:hypothetical protein
MTSVGSYLQQRHLLGLAIDGQDIPMSLSDIMELVIVENVSKRLPAFRLQYKDRTAFLHDNAPISDGSKMGIIMHSGNMNDPESPQDMTFRIMGCEATPAGDAINYRIAGTLDNMKYLRGIAKMPYNDTSNGALKKIAGEVGLKFEGDSTNDKMPWLPRNQTQFFCDFASFIRVHGRNDSKSAMSIGVTDDGRLLYKDLNRTITKSGGRTIRAAALAQVNKGDIPYVHWEVKNINGFANLMHGQGSQILQEQQSGEADLFSLIESLFSGGSLNVSKALGTLLGGEVLKEYVPYDAKNTHDKFYQAKNQNIRGTQLFSNIVEVLTTQATGLHIYDTVQFEPTLPQTNKTATLYAGSYLVSARTRYIDKKNYFEKIRLQSNTGGSGNNKDLRGG